MTEEVQAQGETKTSEAAMAEYRARYKMLGDHIKSVNDRVAPLKERMKTYADESERQRVLAMQIAAEISKQRGGLGWFAIKKEYGMLAKLLGGM